MLIRDRSAQAQALQNLDESIVGVEDPERHPMSNE